MGVLPEAMIQIVRDHIIPAAYGLLPASLASPAATVMLLAIGRQESRFMHRAQIGGPARAFWMFERAGGVAGVVGHPSTSRLASRAITALQYRTLDPGVLHTAIEHNDVLAAVFARLLLWTLPDALPNREQPAEGWRQYLRAWRPGNPHPETWDQFFQQAWDALIVLSTVWLW